MKENIGIIGIGKLGICLALNLESKYNIIGCDVSEAYVKSINDGTLKSNEPKVNELLYASKDFIATTLLSDVIDSCDTIFVMVATPSLPNGKYDHSAIDKVIAEIIKYIKVPLDKPKYLVIGCTVMPTYCESIYNKLISYNMHLAYNPEFIAQGDVINGQLNPDIVLIGEGNKEAGDIVEKIHRSIVKNNAKICRMGLVDAEITKIALNCFCTIKISYANMIGDLAVKVNANPDAILNAIGQDSRVGSKYLKYGDGFGGPCFPRDNRALNVFAIKNGVTLKLSEVVDEANQLHLDNQVESVIKSVKKDELIVIDSITYKKGTNIIEESQRLKRAVALAKKGFKVMVRDTSDVIAKVRDIYGDMLIYETIN